MPSIQIIGDEILFDQQVVARIETKITPSLRAAFFELVDGLTQQPVVNQDEDPQTFEPDGAYWL
jgi:hypothetical protein